MSLLPKVKIAPINPGRSSAPICGAHASLPPVTVDGIALSPHHVAIVRPPVLHHMDDYLALVGNLYYQQSEAGKTTAQWGLIRRTTLGLLTSPTREVSVIGMLMMKPPIRAQRCRAFTQSRAVFAV